MLYFYHYQGLEHKLNQQNLKQYMVKCSEGLCLIQSEIAEIVNRQEMSYEGISGSDFMHARKTAAGLHVIHESQTAHTLL